SCGAEGALKTRPKQLLVLVPALYKPGGFRSLTAHTDSGITFFDVLVENWNTSPTHFVNVSIEMCAKGSAAADLGIRNPIPVPRSLVSFCSCCPKAREEEVEANIDA